MSTSRRGFIHSIAAAGAIPASWTAFTNALHAAPSPNTESYWTLVRQQYPLQAGLIYLNAANVCPSSRPVLDRHQEMLRDFHANPSFQNRAKYKETYERLRGKLAGLLRVSADEIAITRNTSEGTNVVVAGMNLKPGDEVIVTEHNHPSNLDAWKVRAKREGFVVKELPVPIPAKSADELIGGFERAITPKTRVISFTHLTSVTGVQYPAKQIAELGRKRGIWVHLDGAQTFGAFDVNLGEIGCDSYSGSAHKWMMGPLEAGVLFVSAMRIPELWPAIVTAGWADDLKGARKYEVLGQRDDPRVAAFEAAIDWFQLMGASNVEARTRQLAGYLKEKLAALPGVTMKTSMDPSLSAGVLKFQLRGKATEAAYEYLYSKHRVAASLTTSGPPEGVRLSPHVYNSYADLDAAIAAVKACLAS